jgi:hypothetical protein
MDNIHLFDPSVDRENPPAIAYNEPGLSQDLKTLSSTKNIGY